MMGDHLRADLRAIQDLTGTLHGLAQQLNEAFNYPVGDFTTEAGAADLAAALAEFSDNWTIRQANLLSDLNDLGQVAEAAAATLSATDTHLAQAVNGALTKAETPAPPPHTGRRMPV
ncbi:conserved hypothetical protein [Catenulispora acidiphila DSM 44928]|uniref:Uncharacterized protein n=1 Tax=Catenulispora acidiphila (strain DSM 44928 / JCM 14897 / NBRC 102108 / NRRL B-24433 / ID139908) TaxID=479433 RepID=C7Q6H3_CATAD|nr:hypothetical protein [Catenulispora acidiphila]ACU74008.1 conserved hypothetical protein [Catenulispora acidiphila DSM 44928]